jgi:two-component system cell cycle sensor histidine kinase PleC
MKFKRKILRDMRSNRLKKFEEEIDRLSRLNSILIEANEKKNDFFSSISHDLRTPISSILGSVQLIEQKSLTACQHDSLKKHLSTIKLNCYRLLRLVNNILDITKTESGYTRDSLVNCNLVQFLKEITESAAPFAQQKNLTLEFHSESEEITAAIYVDKMERIILNLLSNAIKFTPEQGRIDVSVSEHNGMINISVKDTGTGIPKKMHKKIFEKYQRVNSGISEKVSGSGIGLAIVKSFVELHGGNIKLKSSAGKGSEFIISFKAKPGAQTKTANNKQCMNGKRMSSAASMELSDIYDSTT